MKLRQLAPVLIILVISSTCTLALIQYMAYSSERISILGSDEIRSNLTVETNALSKILANKLEVVTANLETLSKSPVMYRGSSESIKSLMQLRQSTTADLTDFYNFIDSNGKLNWTTTITDHPEDSQFLGADRQDTEWFSVPKSTLQPYYGHFANSIDGISRLFISYPIIDDSGAFRGVIYTGIPPEKIGKILFSSVDPKLHTTATIFDSSGTVLYSDEQSIIGSNFADKQVQSTLSSDVRNAEENNAILAFYSRSIGGDMQQMDFHSSSGNLVSVSSSPVVIGGSHYMTISLRTVHALTGSVIQLLDQQKILAGISMIAIACSAGAVGFVVVTSNRRLEKTVTERTQQLKETMETLDQSNLQLKLQGELQKQFINTAAHELRTPVTPILVVASLDRKNENGITNTVTLPREQFDIIQRNAEKLKRLSDDILDTARIESKQLNLNLETFDIASLITNVIQNARRRIEASDNLSTNIEYTEFESPLMVNADKTKIERVLDNLVSNSLKFCPDGTITINISNSESGEVIISVSDDGLGIDKNMLERLFSKFASNSSDGTGLGLFISKGIVEAHDGRIWARNNASQKGATFSFTLPIRDF